MFRRLLGLRFSSKSAGRGRVSYKGKRRLTVESLEQRTLLALLPTTLNLAASSDLLVSGEALTLTATVAAGPSSSVGPTGMVDFIDSTTHTDLGQAAVIDGVARLTTAALVAGNHSITAHYLGNGVYQASYALAGADSMITTVAGDGIAGFSGDGGPATAAQIAPPGGIAVDASGNIFIADRNNNRVREINHATGVITTIAGNGTSGYSGDGGPAADAMLNAPDALAIDVDGDLLIADTSNYRIREVDLSTGIITTVVGNGTPGLVGNNVPATAAMLAGPESLAVDGVGNLLIGDGFCVRKVDRVTGMINTVAGNGTIGNSGDGGLATAAQFNGSLSGLAVDAVGNLYISDSMNNCVRVVDHATGIVSRIAGGGGGVSDGGQATDARFIFPTGLAVDSAGNLLLAAMHSQRIYSVNLASGVINTLAGDGISPPSFGGDGGPAAVAKLGVPLDIAVDAGGNLFIVDGGNQRIREVHSGVQVAVAPLGGFTPTVTVVNAGGTYTGSPFPAMAQVAGLFGLPADSLEGVVPTVTYYVGTSLSGPGSSTAPTAAGTYAAVAAFAGSAHYAAAQSAPLSFTIGKASAVVQLAPSTDVLNLGEEVALTATVTLVGGETPTGTVAFVDQTTHTELGTASLTGGVATLNARLVGAGKHSIGASYVDANYLSNPSATITTLASLPQPRGMATDSAGNLFVADERANRVYRIDASTGATTVVAGDGAGGDGGPAPSAALSSPVDVAFDGAGNLFIAETGRIRKVHLATGVITTVAGNGDYASYGDGGPAKDAALCAAVGIVVDGDRTLYIAEQFGQRVRAVDLSAGIITTVAGGGSEMGDRGQAIAAALGCPWDVALDGAGNLLIASSKRVRSVNRSTGIITTLVGAAGYGYSGDGGPAINARLSDVASIAVDGGGNLLISDMGNACIRKVDFATGLITTVAGNGVAGCSGDDGPANTAQLNMPRNVVADSAGNLFIADTGNGRIRKVAFGVPVTVVSSPVAPTVTVSDTGGAYNGRPFPATAQMTGVSGRPNDSLDGVLPTVTYYVGAGVNGAGSADAPTAPGTYTVVASFAGSAHYAAAQSDPLTFTIAKAIPTLTVASSTSVAFVDEAVTLSARITSSLGGVAPSGTVDFFDATTHTALGSASLSDGSATLTVSALALGSRQVTVTYAGDDYYAAADALPSVTTVVGNGTSDAGGDGGLAADATLAGPCDAAIDAAGNLFIADGGNNRVRRVDHATRVITTVAGNGARGYSGDGGLATEAALSAPRSVAVDAAGNLFIADEYNYRVRKVDFATGIIATVAGNGASCYSGDGGPATEAGLAHPQGIAIDAAGNLFIADTTAGRVRRMDHVTGMITTVAGAGGWECSGDGGLATNAQLGHPEDIAVDAAGNLFICTGIYHRVCRVDHATGVITTVAGNGTGGNGGDGGLATEAGVGFTSSIALDAAENLLIVQNMRVRKVDLTTGLITTIAGNGAVGYSGDGGPAIDARFSWPQGIAADTAGNLFLADTYNNCIREILGGAPVTVVAGALTPTVVAVHPDQIYTSDAMPATAQISGLDGRPGGSLEGVGAAFTYYLGASVSGAGSPTAPSDVGVYTVVAAFAGSAHYTADESAPVTFSITVAPAVCPGLYDPATSTFMLRTSDTEGPADLTFCYCPAGAGANAKPVAGDWNGDGKTTIGLYSPDSSWFFLRNSNDAGDSDLAFGYGAPGNPNYVLVMGDWTGDGVDTVGLYDRQSAHWFLRNSNTTGGSDIDFGYGEPGSDWTPLVGDWNGDGVDTIGFLDSVSSVYYLRNSNDIGYADCAFGYGSTSTTPDDPWIPVMGDWDGTHTDSIGFYSAGSAHWHLRNTNDQGIADVHFGFGYSNLLPIVGNWLGGEGRGAGDEGQMAVGSGEPSGVSGQQSGLLIPNPQSLAAQAVDRIDLLSVVRHELGHLADLDDLTASSDSLMSGTLAVGV